MKTLKEIWQEQNCHIGFEIRMHCEFVRTIVYASKDGQLFVGRDDKGTEYPYTGQMECELYVKDNPDYSKHFYKVPKQISAFFEEVRIHYSHPSIAVTTGYMKIIDRHFAFMAKKIHVLEGQVYEAYKRAEGGSVADVSGCKNALVFDEIIFSSLRASNKEGE